MLLAGCRDQIVYKGEGAEPSLYVYAVFDNDSLNYVFVGETSFFLDKPNTQCLDDAEVSMQINNETAIKLTYDRDSALYAFDRHLKTGDTLRLTVSHPRLGSAEAVAIVPPEVTMTIKDVEYLTPGEMFDCYAVIEFATTNHVAVNSHYFSLDLQIELEAYTKVFDDEHWNPNTWEYEKDWTTISYWCPYFIVGQSIAAEEGAEEDVDIWNLIYGSDLRVSHFDMKENVIECKIEFDAAQFEHFYNDSLRSATFLSEMAIYPPEYVEFRNQSDKARNESSNPFVEPTQVIGNVKPLEDKPVFGLFAVTRNSRASRYTSCTRTIEQ